MVINLKGHDEFSSSDRGLYIGKDQNRFKRAIVFVLYSIQSILNRQFIDA